MKKNDGILIAVILCAAVALLAVHFFRTDAGSGVVEIYVDGKFSGQYPLQDTRTVDIGETNVLKIHDGQADMVEADCPDKLCVHQRPISRDGETIICLPNKVVVSVRGGEESALDAVTN